MLLNFKIKIKKYKLSYLYKIIEKLKTKKTDKSIADIEVTFNTIGKIITRLVDDVYTHKFKKYPYNLIKKNHLEQLSNVSQNLVNFLKNMLIKIIK